ncbi:helix-turn-helix domain-containing protein [Raoultella sp. HC6]|uniref:helix-turn-helix domain-containing protein n=1 Tax=Raoultella sp. HC6 TaxID=2923366 RepID=UPI001F505F80|nr:helix-turn-helix domain-containing protein [Raoultella sp. HC6]
MPRPTALYVPHVLSAADIAPEERYQQISQNLGCYGIEVANNRRPAEIIATHKTISAISGDYCSAMGSKNQTTFDPHRVEEQSIYISLLVQGHQVINGRKKSVSAQVNPGMLIVHQRNDYYQYQCDDVKQLYIIPRSEKIKEVFNGRLNSPIVSLENHHLAMFLKSHMMLLDSHSASLSLKETATVVDGLHNMALLVLSDIAKQQGLISSGKLGHLVNSAKSFIALHYQQHDLSPDLLSKALHCSRSSLDRAFNEQGTSVMTVLKERRLEAARELLESAPQLRVEQISWLCGFISHPLFSKSFREKYHASPKTWRENYHKAG